MLARTILSLWAASMLTVAFAQEPSAKDLEAGRKVASSR